MALEYIREYRIYFHTSQSYGVSESSAFKTIKWVKNTLIKHPDFSLPGHKGHELDARINDKFELLKS